MTTNNSVEKEEKYKIIKAYGLETRTWIFNEKNGYGCAECCNGDRCDEDCDCDTKYKGNRKGCPHCKGLGWIPLSAVEPLFPQSAEGVKEMAKKVWDFHSTPIPEDAYGGGDEIAEKVAGLNIMYEKDFIAAMTEYSSLMNKEKDREIPDDLQEQVRKHIREHDLFNWDEALTEEEMSLLENLLLTYAPRFPLGSIGYNEQLSQLQQLLSKKEKEIDKLKQENDKLWKAVSTKDFSRLYE